MKTTKFNDEVLYAADAIVQIDASDIEELKQKAKQNPRKRVRICAHKDTKENIHEMIIVHEKSREKVLLEPGAKSYCVIYNTHHK